MPQVKVLVNGRDHMIGCGDGEEDRVRELAAYVDKRASELVEQGARVPDARLLLMTALVIADDLAQAYEELDEVKAGARTPAAAPPGPSSAETSALAQRLEALAGTLEAAD